MTEQELNYACEVVRDCANEYFGDWEQSCKLSDDFRKAMSNCGEIAIDKPEYDAEYLQSKIDTFSDARRKDGKTADEMLDDCRGGALELTWQDIREIVEIADDIAVHEYANRPTGQEDYYTEILRRFKED